MRTCVRTIANTRGPTFTHAYSKIKTCHTVHGPTHGTAPMLWVYGKRVSSAKFTGKLKGDCASLRMSAKAGHVGG